MAVLRTMAAAMAAATLVAATEVFLPPCLDPFQPFVYSGCFQEASGTQIMPYRSPAQSSDMTVEKCVSECKGNGYRYAGLVYYGVCYCGQTVNGNPTTEEQCNFPCNGNSSQTCGANGVFSIYQDPTFAPIEEVTIEDFDPLGCWTDDSSQGRALSYRQDKLDSATLTTEKCLQACRDGGFPFAGTEFGGECYCGVVIGNGTFAAPAFECDMSCNGNSGQKCGGRGRMNLFAADELLSLEPCGYVPPVISSSATTVPSAESTTSTATSTSVAPSTTSTSTSAPPSTTSTSTSAPPSTTSTSLSTVTPPPSSTKPVSTTTTSSSLCVTTSIIPPTCEYKCGKWCSNPIPEWNNDVKNCKAAWSNCALQVASCFKNAGWPASLECFNFGAWCADVERYCSNTPKGKKSDFCGKKPPVSPTKPKTTVITTACPATSTKPASTSTKPASTTTVCPVPTPTNICKQPTNKQNGYGPGKPVGGIELPVVTCNDVVADWPTYPFKQYSDPDTRKCKKYQRGGCSSACSDACKEQYEDCLDVYVEGCRNNRRNKGRSYFDFAQQSEVEKRTWGWTADWTDNYHGATNKCKAQYSDCLSINKYVDINGKCPKPCGW